MDTDRVRRRLVRIITVLTLLCTLFGLTVWYGSLSPAPALGDYPENEHLKTDYERYIDTPVVVNGIVVGTSPVTIVQTYQLGTSIRFTVTDLSIDVENGDELLVYGVVRPDNRIRAINAVRKPIAGHVFMWVVSAGAAVWVLGRLVGHWRIDPGEWTLEPRDPSETIRVQERLHRIVDAVRR